MDNLLWYNRIGEPQPVNLPDHCFCKRMDEPTFKILSDIDDIETIASGRGVAIRRRLERIYGQGNWRKMKGFATVELPDGTICDVELHWYEAHGIGRKEFKIKRIIS